MQIIGQDAQAEATRQALTLHQSERHDLWEKIRNALQADIRVVAAWLFGSGGTAQGGDDLSDLDLFVVLEDEHFNPAVGSPSTRKDFVTETGGHAVITGEAPQNAPPNGAYLGVLYAGSVGPHRVDWYWQRRSAASLPRRGIRLLFDRVGLPQQDAPLTWDYQPIPQETPEEQATRDWGGFWGMLLISAKYVARSPREEGMGLLQWAYVPLNALEQRAGVEQTPQQGVTPRTDASTDFTDPSVKIALLRRLAERMESLRATLVARGIDAGADAAPQAFRYLDLIEAATVAATEAAAQ